MRAAARQASRRISNDFKTLDLEFDDETEKDTSHSSSYGDEDEYSVDKGQADKDEGNDRDHDHEDRRPSRLLDEIKDFLEAPRSASPDGDAALGEEDSEAKRLPLHLRNSSTIMSSMRPSNNPSRLAVRNGIVQQWEPSSSHTNGATASTRNAAPPTPPENADDIAENKRRELEFQIQRQVDENGIERPKGHTVSFHYNRRVENMHFGRTHPMKPWRLTLTKQLVLSYGLQYAMDNYESLPASQETVRAFHDPEYVEFLSK